MKFCITFKDPNCGVMSGGDLVSLSALPPEVRAVLKKWIEFEEYINVEIDTEAGTARVLEA